MSQSTIDAEIDQLWDFNDPAASAERFRIRLAELAETDPAHAALRTQLARALGLQRQFADGHILLDMLAAMPLAPEAAIRLLLERGRLYNSSGDPEQARPYFQEAWEQAMIHGADALAIDAAHMLAIVAPPAEQLAWNLKALDLADRSAHPRAQRWRASLYNNLGWTYHDQGDFATALDYFERGVALRRQQGQAREEQIARWCVGRALRSLGRLAEALAIQRALLAEYEASGEPDGYVFEELAECLLLSVNPVAARPYFAAAYAELARDAWLMKQEPARLARLAELGASD